jgi:hypothetical protein
MLHGLNQLVLARRVEEDNVGIPRLASPIPGLFSVAEARAMTRERSGVTGISMA